MRFHLAVAAMLAAGPAHAAQVACLSQLTVQACCDDAELAAYQAAEDPAGTRGECAVHTHTSAVNGWLADCRRAAPDGCSPTAQAVQQNGDPAAQAAFANLCAANGWAPSTARKLYTCCDNTMDTDGDGLMDCDEQIGGTDPLLMDTDGDTLSDGDEVNLYPTDPTKYDTDDDGLDDGYEVYTAYTDPLDADSDDDGLDDGAELATDPMNDDTDGDGVLDGAEVDGGSDPNDPCDPNACDSGDTDPPEDPADSGDSGDSDSPGGDSGSGDSGWSPTDSGAPGDSGM